MIKVDKTVNEKAVLRHGITTQSVVCIEEMAELQKEISKFIRGKGNKDNLIEEMADVYICLNMLAKMYGVTDQQLNVEILRKQKRTLKRLGEIKYGYLETNSNNRPDQICKP